MGVIPRERPTPGCWREWIERSRRPLRASPVRPFHAPASRAADKGIDATEQAPRAAGTTASGGASGTVWDLAGMGSGLVRHKPQHRTEGLPEVAGPRRRARERRRRCPGPWGPGGNAPGARSS